MLPTRQTHLGDRQPAILDHVTTFKLPLYGCDTERGDLAP